MELGANQVNVNSENEERPTLVHMAHLEFIFETNGLKNSFIFKVHMYYKAINHICEKDPEGPWIKSQELLWKKKKWSWLDPQTTPPCLIIIHDRKYVF